jgi:xanthine/uracil/vitamin C permease (AzgA family)
MFVMAPTMKQTGGDVEAAWRAGLCATVLTGLVQIAGAFCARFIRAALPKEALLSALAGTSLTFLTMGFTMQVQYSMSLEKEKRISASLSPPVLSLCCRCPERCTRTLP